MSNCRRTANENGKRFGQKWEDLPEGWEWDDPSDGWRIACSNDAYGFRKDLAYLDEGEPEKTRMSVWVAPDGTVQGGGGNPIPVEIMAAVIDDWRKRANQEESRRGLPHHRL